MLPGCQMIRDSNCGVRKSKAQGSRLKAEILGTMNKCAMPALFGLQSSCLVGASYGKAEFKAQG